MEQKSVMQGGDDRSLRALLLQANVSVL